MLAPTVHLNGTSREQLLNGAIAAHQALTKAYEELCAMSPNGRDYYPQGQNAINVAIEDHRVMLAKVHDVIAEVQAYAEGLA